jgi:hypothetical protein
MITIDHSPIAGSVFNLIDTLTRYHDAGIDPAFDNDMQELERQFAEYRLTAQND